MKARILDGGKFLAEIKSLEKQINGTSFVGIWSYTEKTSGRGDLKATRKSIDVTGNQIGAIHYNKYIKASKNNNLSEETANILESRIELKSSRLWGQQISKMLVFHVGKDNSENFYVSVHRTSGRHFWDNGVDIKLTPSAKKNKKFENETDIIKRNYKISSILRIKIAGQILYNMDVLKRMVEEGVPLPVGLIE